MTVVIFLMTVFFYNGDKPVIIAIRAPSQAACIADGPKIKAHYEADTKVRYVAASCFAVVQGEKS